MEHIYIVSIQRGQRARGISLMTDSYEDAIITLYNKSNDGRRSDNDTYFPYELHKLPINENLDEEKLGLNSKFRIKFKSWSILKDEYNICNRESKILKVLNKLS